MKIKSIEQKKFYENIKESLNGKEYKLWIDLGVGSIGFAIVSLDDNKKADKIILAGSRIFKPSEGNETRRLKRLQRNVHRHKRERLFKLWQLLSKKGLSLKAPDKLEKEDPLKGDTSIKRFPIEVLSKNVYELRYIAINEKVDLKELGYIIYHLANHRGTASLRTFEEFEESKKKENKEMQQKANNSFKLIKEKNYRTYGEMIYKEKIEPYYEKIKNKKEGEIIEMPKIRNRKNSVDFIPTRDLIMKELDEILNKQKEYYSEILTENYINQIKEIVNFEYEKMVPEPGRCPYFPNEFKLPKAHPIVEERRIWEAINNSRVFEPIIDNNEIKTFKEREFTNEEKEKIFSYLMKNKNITPSKIIDLLNLPDKTEIILQGRDKKNQEIKGYRNLELEKMYFWKRFTDKQKDQFFYDWLLISNDFSLKKKLKEEYKLSDEEIKLAIEKIEIPKGYSPLGKTASIIINEYIKKGLSFTEAIDKAVEDGKISLKEHKIYDLLPYYGEVLDDYTQSIICKALSEKFKDRNYKKPNINKDEERFGRIPNPVVHQTLNELRKLINEIIQATGKKTYEISMEVSRELKKSAEEREKLSNLQDQNEKKRKEIYEKYLKGRNDVKNGYLKFQLFEEQSGICPYCGEQINADDIYNSRVDIDHIFPISESFDNSRNNLVLAHNKCNEEKGQRCPYDAFAGTERYNKILSYLDKTPGMKSKKWRFMEGTYEEFLKNLPVKKRFETDTSYISKAAQKYLNCLFESKTKVIPYKGGVTAQLRLAWDLNKILIPYIKEGLYEKELEDFTSISSLDVKLRMDNRHHAIDAITLAYASIGYSNLINTLAAKGYHINFDKKNYLSSILKPPFEKFSDYVKEKVKDFVVSIKHDHNPNGELLGETFYKVYLLNNKYCLVTKRQVINIDADNLSDIEKELTKGKREIENSNNQELKNILQKNLRILENIKNNINRAKQILEEENKKAKDEGKKISEISNKKIIKKVLEMVKGVYYDISPNKEKGKFFILKEPQVNKAGCGYDTGDNLCIDLYHNKSGKLCGEIIRKVDALNKNFKPNYLKNGFKLYERIYVGDIIELDKSDEKIALKSKVGNSPENRVFVKVTTFTELPRYYKGKLDQIQIYFINITRDQNKPDDSLYISSMKKYKPRKVILTPLGAIKYRSKILGDLNVENN